MSRLFGTDGIRGVANGDLTAGLALDVAVAAARVMTDDEAGSDGAPLAVVGRDTRDSGEFLEAAVVAGLASAGVDVLRLGVLPTPGVAHLTVDMSADLGIVLSASHNPVPDNGIKIFSRAGHKLDDAVEDAIEAEIRQPGRGPTGRVGRVRDLDTAESRYVDHLLSTLPTGLAGYKVVLDSANGAAHAVAPLALEAAGAEVVAIHNTPDGVNINERCGSTHLDDVRAAVVRHGADAGFAYDGDADRCLAVDASGEPVDGDQLLALLAVAMRDAGALRDTTVVSTVMANLGFRQAMERERIHVRTTSVGDRYVLEDMLAHGYSLGGEQSGHVILLDHATTGDGVLTSLHVLARMSATGAGLAELAAVMTRLPQVLINVSGVDRERSAASPAVASAVAEAEAELGGAGRVLLRPSGTEPVVRVMVEAADADLARHLAERLAKVVGAGAS